MDIAKDENKRRKRFKKTNTSEASSRTKAYSLSNCLKELESSWQKDKDIASIWKNWELLSGKAMSEHCQPLDIKNGILRVGASQPQWLQALQYTKSQLLARIQAAGYLIKEIRIQQYHPPKKETKDLEEQEKIWMMHPSRVDVHGLKKCNVCGNPAPAGEIEIWKKCGFCRRVELSDSQAKSSNQEQ